MDRRSIIFAIAAGVCVGALALGAPPVARDSVELTDWPTLAGFSDRRGLTASAAVPLGEPAWVLTAEAGGEALDFAPLSGVAVADGFAYALAERGGGCVLVKVDLDRGSAVWASEIPPAFFDSWATPTVDIERGAVLLASDLSLVAIDAESGAERWRVELDGDAVNSSAAVTGDLDGRDRAFIVDYDFGGREARLYCINVDPFDAAGNPFDPGEIVWSAAIGGYGGTTPAYRAGRVYVATSADGGFGAGRIHAFDATDDEPDGPLWSFTNVRATDFFGGVCVREFGDRTFVYSASYAFDGATSSANLVKLDAADGSLEWSAACNRTSSIPIVLADGRIVLSTGLEAFGSLPMVQIFRDLGNRAAYIWDSVSASWEDLDGDGEVDPGEYLVVGGWNHQPIATLGGSDRLIYAGSIPTGDDFGAYTDLYAIDLARVDSGVDLIREHFAGAGGTPTIAGGYLLTVGEGGLFAFEQPRANYDVDGDGLTDIDDLYAWEQGLGERDVDGDGAVTARDRTDLIDHLRKGEREDREGGREGGES